MELTFSDEYEYIPHWNENKKEDKPVKVFCRYLTTPEREKYISVGYVSVDGELQRRTSFDNSGIVRASVIKIENLKVNGVEIKTAGDLLGIRGLSSLATEIADFAASINVTPDLKNS